MRITTCLIVLFFMLPGVSSAGNVLILDDDYGTEVSDDLISRGHTVTSVLYYDWDGTNPAPAGFDLILLLGGYDYGYDFADPAAGPALLDFVSQGGVFAATEWLAYDMDDGYKLELEPIVPFDYTTYDDYDYSGDYTVSSSSHPLTAGLPATWAAVVDADGGSCVTLKPGATVLVTRTFEDGAIDCPLNTPALVYIGVGSGTAIWLNSDLGHEDSEDASSELLQIIANMLALAASPTEPVPTIGIWGIGILSGMIALMGLYHRRRG